MRRKFPDRPILAVGGIVRKENLVLLVKRKNPPDKNFWSIPGGAVEIRETVLSAIEREIKEECGITVSNGRAVAIIDKIYKKNGKIEYQYCIIDFEFAEFSGNVRPSSDALDAKFFTEEEIEKRKDVVKSVKRLFNEIKNNKFCVSYITEVN